MGAQPSAEFFIVRMDRSDCVPVGAIDAMSLEGARRGGMCSTRIQCRSHLQSLARSAAWLSETGFFSHNR